MVFRGDKVSSRIRIFALLTIVLLAFSAMLPLIVSAQEQTEILIILELHERDLKVVVNAIPPTDDSMTNPDYKLLNYRWVATAKYYVTARAPPIAVATIQASAAVWDSATNAVVFSYQGTTTRIAGKRDNFNVIDAGIYTPGTIGVTYIWARGSQIIETDTRLNTRYKWSLSGEAGKMDVQNIMTHEFGHWIGLADLYSDTDYWLTMYGYSDNGITYQRTLGLGDTLGTKAVCGP
jgi:hypothetical protein